MPGSIDTTLDGAASTIQDYPTSPAKSFSSRQRILGPLLPPSPADSDTGISQLASMETPSGMTQEERRTMREIDRGTPGDPILSEHKTRAQRQIAKQRSLYFENTFAHREPSASAKERVIRESMVLADIRTNVIVQDEYTFITDMSYALSIRYQRPESSILVTVSHSCCLLFGGNFDPAYVLAITALPSQVQPVTNKRNASLLAKAMEDGLGVGPERGVIKFIPIAEENIAKDGKTVAGEIEEMEKEIAETNGNLQRTLSRGAKQRRQSMKSLRGTKASALATHEEAIPATPTPPMTAGYSSPSLPPPPTEPSAMDLRADKVRKMGRRKSFIASIFGKAG